MNKINVYVTIKLSRVNYIYIHNENAFRKNAIMFTKTR